MLKHRLLFGPLMIVLLLGVLALDNWLDQLNLAGTWWQTLFLGRTYLPAGLLMLGLFLGLIVLASRELTRIFHAEDVPASRLMVTLAGCLGCVLLYIIPYQMPSQATMAIYASVMAALFIGSLIRHSWRGKTEGAVTAGAVTMFALIYAGTLPGFFLAIRRWHSAWMVAAIILITKSCDIGAYFTGRSLGKHKLIYWLSPGKTWEGLIGGLATSAVLAVLLAMLANHYHWSGYWTAEQGTREFEAYRMPLWFAAVSGLLLGAIGQLGDLTASLFKRDAGLKDASQTIPGFGGILDVVDSPILVAPIAYWLLSLAAWLGR